MAKSSVFKARYLHWSAEGGGGVDFNLLPANCPALSRYVCPPRICDLLLKSDNFSREIYSMLARIIGLIVLRDNSLRISSTMTTTTWMTMIDRRAAIRPNRPSAQRKHEVSLVGRGLTALSPQTGYIVPQRNIKVCRRCLFLTGSYIYVV